MTARPAKAKRHRFLSTPSARRATGILDLNAPDTRISIHALREEGDNQGIACGLVAVQFLSTPSARRATHVQGTGKKRLPISIHALREEGDFRLFATSASETYFYPRPPRGGRPQVVFPLSNCLIDFYPRPPRGGRRTDNGVTIRYGKFLSTPSARRATRVGRYRRRKRAISIHALREEGDLSPLARLMQHWYFYPRPPRGGRRLCITSNMRTNTRFLSTPSARRATYNSSYSYSNFAFLSTPSARRATGGARRGPKLS